MGQVLEAMEGRVLGTGVQEFKSSRVQEFRSLEVQEFRSSGVQEFRSSGVQEFRSAEVQEFKYWKQWRVMSGVRTDKRNTPSD